METNMKIVKIFGLLAITSFFSVSTYSQILTIGANCLDRNNKKLTLSVVFDSTSRRAIFYTDVLNTAYDEDTLTSNPITTPLRFEDRNNPLKITSLKDRTTSYVLFTTKNSISISNSRGTTVYGCQAYFPRQLGMR